MNNIEKEKNVVYDRIVLDRKDMQLLFFNESKLTYEWDIAEDIDQIALPLAKYDPEYKGTIFTYDDYTDEIIYDDITLHKNILLLFWCRGTIVQELDLPRLFYLGEKHFNFIHNRNETISMSLDDIQMYAQTKIMIQETYCKPSNFKKKPVLYDDIMIHDNQVLFLLQNNVVSKEPLDGIFQDKKFHTNEPLERISFRMGEELESVKGEEIFLKIFDKLKTMENLVVVGNDTSCVQILMDEIKPELQSLQEIYSFNWTVKVVDRPPTKRVFVGFDSDVIKSMDPESEISCIFSDLIYEINKKIHYVPKEQYNKQLLFQKYNIIRPFIEEMDFIIPRIGGGETKKKIKYKKIKREQVSKVASFWNGYVVDDVKYQYEAVYQTDQLKYLYYSDKNGKQDLKFLESGDLITETIDRIRSHKPESTKGHCKNCKIIAQGNKLDCGQFCKRCYDYISNVAIKSDENEGTSLSVNIMDYVMSTEKKL